MFGASRLTGLTVLWEMKRLSLDILGSDSNWTVQNCT